MRRATLLIFLISALAAASSTYTVAVIQAPTGYINVSMSGINNSGQVTGNGNSGGPNPQPFIASPTGSAVIPVPAGWSWAYVVGLNNLGQVTGYGYAGNGNLSFIGTISESIAIPRPPGWYSASGIAINDSGQITGYGTPANLLSPYQAFIATISGSTPIPIIQGFVAAAGHAISASGQVAGEVLPNAGPGISFIGTPSGSTAIALPSGWPYTYGAYAINSSGSVAGFGVNSLYNAQAYIGTAESAVAIPLPYGATAAAVSEGSMNDLGVVVGGSAAGSNNVGGWIWNVTDGTVLLSDLVPVGWTVTNAISISNNGLILAQASYNGGASQYVELTPTNCQFSLTPPSVSASASVSISSFSVTTSAGCDWQAVSNSTWIAITSGASGTGSGTVGLNINENLAPTSRTGTLTVGGQTFTVTQAAGPVAPPALNSPPSPLDGSTGVSLTPTLAWSASSGATGYDIYFGGSPPSYVATTIGLNYSPGPLSPNTTYYWRVVAHNGTSSASSPIVSFTTIDPSCTFAVSPVLIGYAGGPASLTVTTGPACYWTASTGAPWLMITSRSGTGSGTISLTADPNSGAARIARIAFVNQVVNVMQAGSPASQLFNDVSASDPYFDYVSLMYTDGITAGCSTSPSLYCPNTPVTRAQMSVFIVAAINRALGTSLTYTQTPYFQDVPSTSTYFPFVQRIKDLGITAGCSTTPALFCPDDSISEGQMAVFMIVGWMLENNLSTFTYTTTPYFTDVQPGDSYFKFVQKMRDLGIWTGCSQTLYCESSAVTRDQMAPMIMRSLLGAP